MSSDNVIIAGYPKSGNTWLGYMITYGLQGKYIDLHRPNQPPTSNKGVCDKIGWGGGHKEEIRTVCKTHSLCKDFLIKRSKYRILLVRDPRDVVVSYYYYIFFNQKLFNNKKIKKYNFIGKKLRFKYVIAKVIKEWTTHINSWEKEDNLFICRYEDLLRRPQETLFRVFEYLETNKTCSEIKTILNEFSFTKLSNRERDVKDNAAFYRKGIIGDYKNEFDFLDNLIFIALCKSKLKSYNYL